MADWELVVNKSDPRFILRLQAIRSNLPKFECAKTLDYREKTFDYGNKLGVMVSMSILSENIAEFKKPSDWWEAFKERWFPKWALSFWPVKYDRINVKALYPNASYQDEKIIWKAEKAA